MRTFVTSSMAVLCFLAMAADSRAAVCDDTPSPEAAIAPSAKRPITALDLVRLRDIGPPSLSDQRAGLFALSPDGSKIAFQIRRADPATDTYCLGMYVLDRKSGGAPVEIDRGGEVIMATYSAWGFAVSPPPGIPKTITPQWSPDGTWILYLRRDHGTTQIWRARTDRQGVEPVSRLPFDVETFLLDVSGDGLVLSGRPDLIRSSTAITAEGKSGYRYDDRFMPAATTRPLTREPIAEAYFHIDLSTGTTREATSAEQERLSPSGRSGDPLDAIWVIRDGANRTAWLAPRFTDDVTTPADLHIRLGARGEQTCLYAECDGVDNLWFTGKGDEMVFVRHHRGAKARELYRWTPGTGRPMRILTTENLLGGCLMAKPVLLCAEEQSDQPRRLVEVNLNDGQIRPVFDPNPEFSGIRLGQVQTLSWTNAYGIETYGDLVLPPDHKPGQRHPLIVVGYNSRGFLRGGTGDDFPIQLFAARGFAVLSYQTPIDIGYVKGARTWADMNRIARIDWLDFRSTSSSIEVGVDAAIALGVVEPTKLGLTGFSYGSTTAQFTLVNNKRFGAAALSSCCEEASITNTLMGPAMVRFLHDAGYPGLAEDGAAFWAPISFRANAATVTTPILFQVPDREVLGALEGFTALKDAGQPVDMYVFPDEGHLKWAPAHRLASYTRVVDWFDFWLRDVCDPAPEKARQCEVWRALRWVQ